ncbi:PilW family protein [Aquipseudomonas ullengensis]|uniref:Prepilin-type N-terminal cleavage/methylation domain-containing protein n=1 Tax=Aquipseudomonas ullengensis TaxID=2759166 RepID=A0A7W4QEA4_9GAMM|nr:prepilin-type N-terminal cleavage/methylation domain-containing protein [Pseudomonas ullengensis]MBB2495408.1 prepilin-type N-terminal cleavage/methylation domain-containing protein [Pseudomonas ullengensis]
MKNYSRGFSLVELMVAVLISSILILGVTDLFMSSYFSSRNNTELAQMQESGRIALEIIGADARRAGYQGCGIAADTETPLPNSGGTLPDDAVTSTAASNITFRYAVPGSGCTDATGSSTALDLTNPPITYSSANNTISRNDDPILDDASMAVEFLPSGSAVSATAIRVTITISDSRGANEITPLNARTFSGTYELRNRLL